VSIVTSLLPANYKENLMTRFSTKSTKAILKARLYLFMLPWQWYIHQLAIKKPKFALLTCLLPILATKGSRVLEKKVNET